MKREVLSVNDVRCNKQSKYTHYIWMLMAFAICFLYKSKYFFCDYSLRFYGDSLGPLATAAYLAGNDWTDAISNTPYYGFGYYWIVFLFFRLTDDYRIIFLMIIFTDLIITTLIAVLIYSIVSKRILQSDGFEAVAVAVIASSMYTYWVTIMNEHPAFIIIWISCWLLFKCVDSTEKPKLNACYSFLLALVISYSVTVHERLIVLYIAVFVATIFFRILKIKSVNIFAFLASSVMLFVVGRVIRNKVIDLLWGEGELQNTSVISLDAIDMFSVDSIKGMLTCVLTNLYKVTMSSYGIAMWAIVVFVIIFTKMIIRSEKTQKVGIHKDSIKVYFVHTVFLLAVGITIFGLAFNQGGYIAYGFKNAENSQSYKALFYYRYYALFLGPLFVTTIGFLRMLELKKCIKPICIGVFVLFKWILSYVLPKIASTSYVGTWIDFSSVLWTWKEVNSYSDQIVNFMISTIVMFVMLCLVVWGSKRANVIYLVIVLWFILPHDGGYKLPEIKSNFDATYEFVQELEEKVDLPQVIYSNWYDYRTLQFVLNRYTILLREMPDNDEDKIYISNRFEGKLSDFYYIKLSESEYLYFKGDTLVKNISKYYSGLLKVE